MRVSEMLDELRRWIGRERTVEDLLALGPARGLCALLDREAGWVSAGEPLPPLWHWLYLHDTAPQGRLGPDGHERRGDFLPPVALPRRVWAGGHVRFLGRLLLGAPAARTSTVEAVEEKHGRSGGFVRVTVRHRLDGPEGPAVDEVQQLAYRAMPEHPQAITSPDPPADLPTAQWSDEFEPTPVALFRFSALTFNSHRIHYDQPYVTGTEAYPGLIVHAPLLALLLLDAAARRRPGAPAEFQYRALAPAFAGRPLRRNGSGADATADVWAESAGQVVMRGRVR